MRRQAFGLGMVAFLLACGGKSPSGEDAGATDTDTGGVTLTASSTGSSSPTSVTDADTSDSATTMSSADGNSETATDSSADSASESEGSGSTGGTNDPNDPLDCNGKVYACGDGEDNDGDGKIDLDDPECTGPCDDDEGSFQTGIPGDNVDCKQDCFFDGNSGQGDDKCLWDLKCDPENPGEHVGCAYTGGNNCNNMPPNQSPHCIMFCLQYVPPGCDCFGCCTVQTPDGPVDIFLNSHPDCSFDNLDACQTCTQSEDCVNKCEPAECELCFGQDELDPDCKEAECPNDAPSCQSNADCPTDYYCFQQCCYPPPPG